MWILQIGGVEDDFELSSSDEEAERDEVGLHAYCLLRDVRPVSERFMSFDSQWPSLGLTAWALQLLESKSVISQMKGAFFPSMVWCAPIIIVHETAESFYDTSFNVPVQALLPAFPYDGAEKEGRDNDDYDGYCDGAPEADDVVQTDADHDCDAAHPVGEISLAFP